MTLKSSSVYQRHQLPHAGQNLARASDEAGREITCSDIFVQLRTEYPSRTVQEIGSNNRAIELFVSTAAIRARWRIPILESSSPCSASGWRDDNPSSEALTSLTVSFGRCAAFDCDVELWISERDCELAAVTEFIVVLKA